MIAKKSKIAVSGKCVYIYIYKYVGTVQHLILHVEDIDMGVRVKSVLRFIVVSLKLIGVSTCCSRQGL